MPAYSRRTIRLVDRVTHKSFPGLSFPKQCIKTTRDEAIHPRIYLTTSLDQELNGFAAFERRQRHRLV